MRCNSETTMKRLATYLPDPIYEELDKWAAHEKRSLSNLVAFLLEQAVRGKRQQEGTDGESEPR
jgi:hypothetical protein